MLCTCGLLWALLQLGSCLLLGAFNIRTFGPSKVAKPVVMAYINTIIHRYDIILIQEIRDPTGSVTQDIVNSVNRAVPGQYNHIVSAPLGRTSYRERYLFLYKANHFNVINSYTYGNTNFSRPPFIVNFSLRNQGRNFVLVPLHATPGRPATVRELDCLFDVVADVRTRWSTNNILLLGDFNAGGTYVTTNDWNNIKLFTDKSFSWLIPNNVCTAVSGNNCAYDRIVATSAMLPHVNVQSARVYNFQTALGLTQDTAQTVSDHFPVEVDLI